MKVIDLLVAISKDEKTPEKFELGGMKYHKDMFGRYKDEDGDYLYEGLDTTFMDLNNEIEIIEEEKKIQNNLKKMLIPSIKFNLGFIDTNDKEVVIKEMNKTIQDLYDRTLALNTQINEIIDYINKENNND